MPRKPVPPALRQRATPQTRGSGGSPLIRWDGGRSLRYHFAFKPADGGAEIAFQVTVKSAGGKAEAERICHLCAARFVGGATREEVIAYRESLYKEAAGAAAVPRTLTAATGAPQSRSGVRQPPAQEQAGPAEVVKPKSRSGVRKRPSASAEPAATIDLPAPAKRRSGIRRRPSIPAEPDADDLEQADLTMEDAAASDAGGTSRSPTQDEQLAAGELDAAGPVLRWDNRHERFHFRSRPSQGSVQFQVTVKAAGSKATAEQICRLCMAKFESGASREEVMAFRDSLYRELAGAAAMSWRLSSSSGAAEAQQKPKRRSGRRRTKSELAAMEAQRQAEAAEPPRKKRQSGKRRPKGEVAASGARQEVKLVKSPPIRRSKFWPKVKKVSAPPADDVDEEYASHMREWEQAELSGLNEVDEVTSEAVSAALCTVLETSSLRAVPAASAAKALVDGIQLNSDVVLPVVGFGTYKLKKGDCLEPVLRALQVGYRLIDTAQIYDNEGDVGEALRQSGVPRDRVCLETKHWRSSHGYERTLNACRGSLKRLGVDYIDLYLIHWPGCKTGWPLPRGVCSPADWTPAMRDEGTWRAMEQLYQEGKVKALGVSNYSIRHLKALLKMCRVRPSVNQVEFHPWLVQSELLEFCKQEGIVLQAYASLGSGDVSSRADFFALKPVREAAKTHDKTSAQILLRWAMDKGITVLPKSKSTDRMVENFGVFDFKLSAAEVAAIDRCHRGHRFAWKHVDPDTVP